MSIFCLLTVVISLLDYSFSKFPFLILWNCLALCKTRYFGPSFDQSIIFPSSPIPRSPLKTVKAEDRGREERRQNEGVSGRELHCVLFLVP